MITTAIPMTKTMTITMTTMVIITEKAFLTIYESGTGYNLTTHIKSVLFEVSPKLGLYTHQTY